MCAPHCPTPSPTPSAAPSVPQSPGTAPGAPIGRTAPAGRIYLTSAGNIAYTYADGGFWMYWFERTCPQWKPTALLAERYARENRGPEMRSPDQWLAEYAAGHDFKEITQKEFETMCETGIAPSGDAAATTGGTAALGPQQREIQTTPADADGRSGRLCPVDASAPVTGGPMTQDLAGTATGQAMPSFDYSGLDEQTVADLHLAEREYASGKRLVETGLRRMADGVAIAHDALCGRARPNLGRAQNNQYSEDTFRRWCESMQISKTAAYRLLQVSRLMESSSPKEEKVLEQLAPSLLYEVSKPSAPAELVQAVKEGEITTHKEYQALLAQLKAERDKAAVREAALRKELTDLREDNEQVSTEMLALQSELCELRRQTDQGQGDPVDPTRYAAAACRAILLPELERIAQLPNGAYRDAMEVLYELSDALGYACANGGSWPQEATEPDTSMEDAPEDAEEDAEFEEWPGWMHQKWAEEHPEEGDPA